MEIFKKYAEKWLNELAKFLYRSAVDEFF